MSADLAIAKRMEERVQRLRLAEKRRKAARRADPHPKNFFRYQKQYNVSVGRKINWVDLNVPEHLSFNSKMRDNTCIFFRSIEDVVKSGSSVRLIFEDTKVIALDSLTYLLALIQKIRWLYGQNAITGTYPSSVKVERLLTDSGFFKILGVTARKRFNRGEIRYVKYRSDTQLLGSHIQSLRHDLLGEDFQLNKAVALKIVRALKEAMSNVSHHAYTNKSLRTKKLQGRWWLTGYLDVAKDILSFSFYDCGVGIPKTLVRQYGIEYVRKLASLLPIFDPDDAQMIEAAVQLGRSGTQELNRGKGLQDMHNLIKKVGQGSLTIHSRFGSYRYDFPNSNPKNYEQFLEGTLITWELPLSKVIENMGNLVDQDGDDDVT